MPPTKRPDLKLAPPPDWSKRWSSWGLLVLDACPERFRRQVLERERTPSTLSQLRGQAFHRQAAEVDVRAHSARADHPNDRAARRALRRLRIPSVEEIRDLAASDFDRAVKVASVSYTEDEREEGLAKARGRTKDELVRGAGLYVDRVAPFLDPVAVEQKIEVRPKTEDIVILGRIDLINEIDGAPPFTEPGLVGELEIRDKKTSTRAPKATDVIDSMQLSIYALLHWYSTGKLPKRVGLDVLVTTPKAKETYHQALHSTRDMSDLKAIVAKIRAAVALVRAGVFVGNTTHWSCSAKWCAFWTTCRFVSDRRRAEHLGYRAEP